MTASARVSALRALMAERGLHAFIVPSEDAHMSEYVASCDERRAFISGFTGSAGTALITADAALCWTDGRYFVQAAKQLDPSVFTLMRMHEDPPLEEWIVKHIPDGAVVAVDGRTISITAMKRLRAAVAAAPDGRRVVVRTTPADEPNLVDLVWGSARPAVPASTVKLHDVRFAGVSVPDKLATVRARMEERDAGLLVVAALDEVAWLLNLRGSDVEYNPVFWAYVTITPRAAALYVNSTRFAPDVALQLRASGVEVKPYEALLPDLAAVKVPDGKRVWLDLSTCNYAIQHSLEKGGVAAENASAAPANATASEATPAAPPKLLCKQGPIPLAKARKCAVELAGMRACHVRDGAALCKFLCWLEAEVAAGREPTEIDASDKLDGLRSELELYVSLSFPTISSADANGAIVHYRADSRTARRITRDSMYLVDSGGQYHDGTTDVTRTMHFGEPSAWQRECFTRVLQGHIAIDSAVFPKGTTGHLLDGFARQSLWSVGLDYKHGTGHGVGSFLNVHEGPHVISFKPQALDTPLEPGFLTSNEPGYYEEDGFGIRIENLCIVTDAKVNGPPGGTEKPFYAMEHITLAPLQAKLIDVGLLSDAQRRWVDAYHTEVREKLSPLLKGDETTLEWLERNTKSLPTA